jgi:Domain of Unknown Function (DUF1080)
MKNSLKLLLLFVIFSSNFAFAQKAKKGWYTLYDGKSFDGWKVNEDSPSSFSIAEDGTIKIAGPRTHLFYDGPVGNHNFKNFEFKITAKTLPGSNSGLFIHTAYQAKGWPSKGYEIQVNQSHTDWRRTGSLYGVQDVKDTLVKDNEWYTYHIIVKGKNIVIKINDKVAVNYTEPDELPADRKEKRLSSGTFALQAHDPKSIAYFKDIKVKILKD